MYSDSAILDMVVYNVYCYTVRGKSAQLYELMLVHMGLPCRVVLYGDLVLQVELFSEGNC